MRFRKTFGWLWGLEMEATIDFGDVFWRRFFRTLFGIDSKSISDFFRGPDVDSTAQPQCFVRIRTFSTCLDSGRFCIRFRLKIDVENSQIVKSHIGKQILGGGRFFDCFWGDFINFHQFWSSPNHPKTIKKSIKSRCMLIYVDLCCFMLSFIDFGTILDKFWETLD